jgi:hypothetical protein
MRPSGGEMALIACLPFCTWVMLSHGVYLMKEPVPVQMLRAA